MILRLLVDVLRLNQPEGSQFVYVSQTELLLEKSMEKSNPLRTIEKQILRQQPPKLKKSAIEVPTLLT